MPEVSRLRATARGARLVEPRAAADEAEVKLLAAATAVVLLGFGAYTLEAHARARTQRTLGGVASALAGRPLSVRCQSFWGDLLSADGHLGEVRFDAQGRPGDSAWLTRSTCGRLHRFVASHGADLACLKSVDWSGFRWDGPHGACVDRAASVGQAVVILAHEAAHLRGIRSESWAQCVAEQTAARTVALLGGDPATGPALERLARAWNPFMGSEYQTSCPAA
jgi:hypothetical protein